MLPRPATGIPHGKIAAELDKVVVSAAFGKAERPARFLRHLVETALRGESDLLKESVLGMDVFGRPASWDPRLDPVVRQEAARLRKRLAAYYESDGAENEIRIELPVGAYAPVFRRQPIAIQTAPTVVAPAQPSFPPPARRRRVWLYATAGILCMAAAVAAWRGAFHREAPVSIVVLPFANLTADPADQYFSDGLTDEITDSLARINKFRVIASSSAFQFKRRTVDVREVGRRLNVTNILEGSVERSGDRIKIIARLERVSDGSLLWSNTYELKATDLFAVQSELAAGIAGSLKSAGGSLTAKHVPNAEAYELVLKARYDVQQLTPEALVKAEAEYQRAIELDPRYGAAYLGLASAKYDRFVARGSSFQTEAERRSAEELYRKALELDPDSPTGHAMLAGFAMQYDWDWKRAERELQLAVAGPSSATAEGFYAFLLTFQGHFAEADRHIRHMLDLDPFSISSMNNLAVLRHLQGRFMEAREICQTMVTEYPKAIAPQELLGGTYIEEGQPQLALAVFRKLEPSFPKIRLFEAMAYARAGDRETALQLTRPFEERYADAGVSMEWFALVYALLGDQPQALTWLERSADRHEWQVLAIADQSIFAPMGNSPGFQALKKRIGLD